MSVSLPPLVSGRSRPVESSTTCRSSPRTAATKRPSGDRRGAIQPLPGTGARSPPGRPMRVSRSASLTSSVPPSRARASSGRRVRARRARAGRACSGPERCSGAAAGRASSTVAPVATSKRNSRSRVSRGPLRRNSTDLPSGVGSACSGAP